MVHLYTYLHIFLIWDGLKFISSFYSFWHFQHMGQEGHQTISRTMTVRRSHTGHIKVWVLGRAGHFSTRFSWQWKSSALRMCPHRRFHKIMSTKLPTQVHVEITPQPMEFPGWKRRFLCQRAVKPWNPALTEIMANSSNLMAPHFMGSMFGPADPL